MLGILLIVGVICAFLSVVALGAGIAMLALGIVLDNNQCPDKDYTTAFFVVVGRFYLGIAALLGMWVPAVCWIFLAPIALTLAFLAAIKISFGGTDEEEQVV
jgi:hypothetical protein